MVVLHVVTESRISIVFVLKKDQSSCLCEKGSNIHLRQEGEVLVGLPLRRMFDSLARFVLGIELRGRLD